MLMNLIDLIMMTCRISPGFNVREFRFVMSYIVYKIVGGMLYSNVDYSIYNQ